MDALIGAIRIAARRVQRLSPSPLRSGWPKTFIDIIRTNDSGMTVPFYGDLLRQFIWGAVELQILASVVLLGALVLVLQLVRGLRTILGNRYTANFAEAVEMAAMAFGIVVTAYLLAEVWAISFVFDQAVGDLLINRWIFVRSAISIAVLASGYMLLRVVNRIIDALWRDEKITRHQKEVSYHVFDATIIVVAMLLVLSVWGDDPSNVLIGAGVLSAVLGLAAQKTVSAVIAGFALLFTRPFEAGDWIEVAGDSGDSAGGIVQDVTVLHTKLRTFNDEHVLVPNDEVTANLVTNYTRSDRFRIDIEVDVDYGTDLEHARAVLADVGENLDRSSSTREPRAVLKRYADSSIVFELQFWIHNPTRSRVWEAQTDAIAAVKAAFDSEGITIPFPQRTHTSRDETGFRVSTGESDVSASEPVEE